MSIHRRRASRLAGMNPVTATSYTAREETSGPGVSEEKAKITFQFNAELAGKLRGAFQADGPRRGVVSLSAWVEEILRENIAAYEAEHGEVKPLPPRSVATGWNASY